MYDVAIIGLGPAGSVLASLLEPSLSVLALDKKHGGDESFRKPCGGLLAPDAQKALARLGLTLPLDVMVSPQIFSVSTVDLNTGLRRHYQRFYLNLDRHRFDRWLRSRIPAHVDARDNARCTSVEREGDHFRLTWRENGEERSATARYVAGADGAGSRLRRQLYPGHAIKSYLSLQQWFRDEHARPFYSCVFDHRATDCYAWGLSKNDHFIFGGAFAPKTAKGDFARLKESLATQGFRLDRPVRTEACQVLRPNGLTDIRTGRDGAFLLGEAAGFISPSSLEGISHAVNSACILAEILNRKSRNPNRQYFRRTLPIRLKLFLKTLKCPFLYQPFLRRLVMASGLDSIPVIGGEE